MTLPKRALRKHLSLLAALVAALVMACTGVVFAQGSTANPGYEKANPVKLSDTPQGSASARASVSNGGFEAGNFNGWTVANQAGGSGDWFVYSGTTSPQNNFSIAAPPVGSFAATTDQSGPGSHVLYKNINLKPNMKHMLSFQLYYQNRATVFSTPQTLDFNTFPNQQYRVDLMRPNADPFSVDPNAILATIFRTKVGDPATLEPTRRTFNLTRFAGKAVRVRFAEVDNQGNFLASVDAVKVRSTRR